MILCDHDCAMFDPRLVAHAVLPEQVVPALKENVTARIALIIQRILPTYVKIAIYSIFSWCT